MRCLNIGYFFNYPPISYILECPLNSKSPNQCFEKEYIQDTLRYLNDEKNSDIFFDKKFINNSKWESGKESIYKYLSLNKKDFNLVTKSIEENLKNFQEESHKRNYEVAKNLRDYINDRMITTSVMDMTNIAIKNDQFPFDLDILILFSKKYFLENKPIVEFGKIEYKQDDISNYLKIFLYLSLGSLIFLAYFVKQYRSKK